MIPVSVPLTYGYKKSPYTLPTSIHLQYSFLTHYEFYLQLSAGINFFDIPNVSGGCMFQPSLLCTWFLYWPCLLCSYMRLQAKRRVFYKLRQNLDLLGEVRKQCSYDLYLQISLPRLGFVVAIRNMMCKIYCSLVCGLTEQEKV